MGMGTASRRPNGVAGSAGQHGGDRRLDHTRHRRLLLVWRSPANSWSTGAAGSDGVTTHYERLRALNPTLTAYNDSAAGAKMAAGHGQARVAVSQQAQYVTVLLGANDLCTSTPQDMTPAADFRAQTKQSLDTLANSPTAEIFVSSIPNVYWLWQIEHTNPVAQFVWRSAGICQSLLAVGRTEAERQLVRQRNGEFNAILGEECAALAKCRFDGNAVFNYPFAPAQVSRLDYFHPSLAGQAALADVTWATGWWR
jgi:lysophospholipase L1-like esterase